MSDLLAHFTEYFRDMEVYRRPTRANSFDDKEYTRVGTVNAMRQTISGSYQQSNGANKALTTDRLYIKTGVDVIENDYILDYGQYYKVEYRQPDAGIGGTVGGDHQEMELVHYGSELP